MSTQENNIIISDFNEDQDYNKENKIKNQKKINNQGKYPLLIQKGDKKYKYSSKIDKEEKKEDIIEINKTNLKKKKEDLNM